MIYTIGYKRGIFLLIEKGGVNCGNHIAPKCEDCILDIGPDGCLDNGDCFLNKTTSTCTKKGIFIFFTNLKVAQCSSIDYLD